MFSRIELELELVEWTQWYVLTSLSWLDETLYARVRKPFRCCDWLSQFSKRNFSWGKLWENLSMYIIKEYIYVHSYYYYWLAYNPPIFGWYCNISVCLILRMGCCGGILVTKTRLGSPKKTTLLNRNVKLYKSSKIKLFVLHITAMTSKVLVVIYDGFINFQ